MVMPREVFAVGYLYKRFLRPILLNEFGGRVSPYKKLKIPIFNQPKREFNIQNNYREWRKKLL